MRCNGVYSAISRAPDWWTRFYLGAQPKAVGPPRAMNFWSRPEAHNISGPRPVDGIRRLPSQRRHWSNGNWRFSVSAG
jgi:hypothetical protein